MPIQGKISFIFWLKSAPKLDSWRIQDKTSLQTLKGTFQSGEKELTQILFHSHEETVNKIIPGTLGI